VSLVALERVTEQEWDELIAGESEPWGGGIAERLRWRDKTRNVGIRARDGRLLAVAGTVRCGVQVAPGARFDVLGVGGVFVSRDARGRGLVARLLEGLLPTPHETGPERAMLFCRPQLAGMYRKFDFREIADPVWAQQPAGAVCMPLNAMWRPLRAGVAWPAGRVDVLGLPF
jgi:Acetyltransferase (GNAT) domain